MPDVSADASNDTGMALAVTSLPAVIPGYQARPGWDPVTGWGTPDARVLVPLLAR